VAAQDYPSKIIHIIVPYAPGSVGDTTARLVAAAIEPRLGQRVLVETRPGAGGNIGAAAVASAAPDGHTLLLGATNNFAINQFLYSSMTFDPMTAFAPIMLVADVPSVIFVSGAVPASTFRDFVEYARANPGKLNFASPSAGTTPHLAGELLNQLAGIRMVHVPYRGAGPAMLALVAGEVQMYMVGLVSGQPHLASGKIKALAVAAPQRLPGLPDVPTTAEAGFPQFKASNWWGLAAPKGTPRPIIERLNREIAAALTEPGLKARFEEAGLVPVASSPEAFAAQIREDAALWQKTIQSAGLTLN
jgi:tripartite-type tricarboxylate transporter receptor subunit TctC